MGVSQNSLQVSLVAQIAQVAPMRNLRCELCPFFQLLRILRCALCLFFQRLRHLGLQIRKSNICSVFIAIFSQNAQLQNKFLIVDLHVSVKK